MRATAVVPRIIFLSFNDSTHFLKAANLLACTGITRLYEKWIILVTWSAGKKKNNNNNNNNKNIRKSTEENEFRLNLR